MNRVEKKLSVIIVQQYLDRYMRIRCRGNPFTEQLPSDTPGIVDVFTDRYQVTHVPSRHRCIGTAIHATIYILCIQKLSVRLTVLAIVKNLIEMNRNITISELG
jgi:hypothetical protein